MAKNRSTDPNRARWIMIGRWRALSAPTYSIPKRCGKLEVQLDGRHLVGPADGVAGLDGDLRSVERSPALVEHHLQVH